MAIRKLLLFYIPLICTLGGTGFGKNPVYRVGIMGVWFYPLHQPPTPWVEAAIYSNRFEPFRGLGCETGRVSEHFDVSLEAHFDMAKKAKNASERWYDYAVLYMVTPRVAYRLMKRCTPYIGVGSGYQWLHYHSNAWGNMQVIVDMNYSSITFEPFVGYDYRVTNRFGLKLEGRYQIVNPGEGPFAEGLRGSAGAYLAFGGK